MILAAIGREALWWLLWPVDALFCITLTLAAWGLVWLGMRGVEHIETWFNRRGVG